MSESTSPESSDAAATAAATKAEAEAAAAEAKAEAAITPVVSHLAGFVAEHGGSGTAVVSYLGRAGARIVVVAKDGLFADAVVASVELGSRACERAGIPVGSWTRELTSVITPSPADRRRMAGTGR